MTADGSKTFPATLSTGYNTTAFPGTYTIAYTKDGQPFDGTPTEAGDYTASVTVGTATASVSYTVAAPTYTVTWKNWNGDVLETDDNVAAGTTPTYDGEAPTKAEDDENTYTFAGTAWTIDPAYKLTQNLANEAEYMLAETAFTADTEFKVVYVAPGTRTWYLDKVPNYEISEDGNYSIYFRPDGQGGNDWHYGTIYASAAATEPITVLVGHFHQLRRRYRSQLLYGAVRRYRNQRNREDALHNPDRQRHNYAGCTGERRDTGNLR